MRDMSIPLQFASLYNGQEVFVWSDCLLDLGMDVLVGNVVFVYVPTSLIQPCLHFLELVIQTFTIFFSVSDNSFRQQDTIVCTW